VFDHDFGIECEVGIKMVSLITCEIWRDGGSISAVVLDGQRHKAFWLQTNHWNHPRERGHENLFVSEGNNPESKENRIEIASPIERQWMDYLARVDDGGAGQEEKKLFQTMIQLLQERQKNLQ
jgi:hypothetical protein